MGLSPLSKAQLGAACAAVGDLAPTLPLGM